VDLRSVQELLGHRSITMTTRYSHLSPSHLAQAVQRLVATAPREAAKIDTVGDTATDTAFVRRSAFPGAVGATAAKTLDSIGVSPALAGATRRIRTDDLLITNSR
jgi:hypothetical protein